MTTDRDLLISRLQSLLGEDRVSTSADLLTRRSMDTWPLPLVQLAVGGPNPAPPVCVLRPRDTAEVASALGFLHEQGIPVVPFGGGSGVTGGAAGAAGSVVLDVGAMDQILSLDETNLTVTVQPGVFQSHLEAWLNERGYITGHYPQSVDVAQVGGLVATRSAGQFSTKYGNIEDLVMGLEAVLPSGETVRIKPVPRRAAGPDLRQFWLGSEGTFGVITEVTLKIFPVPAERWMHAYGIPSMGEGLEIIRRIMREGWRPAVIRLHDATEAARSYQQVVREGEAILLLLSEGPQGYAQTEGQALDRIVLAGGGRSIGPEPVEAWLHHRNDVHEFEQFIRMGFIVDTIEVAAGWNEISAIYHEVIHRLTTEVPELVVASGHSSHSYPQGTNLYFIIGAKPPRVPQEVARVYWSIWSRVMEATLANSGTISHHHGIGKLRAPWLPDELGSSYVLLQRLKQAMDPQGLMNPGTLIPAPGATKPQR